MERIEIYYRWKIIIKKKSLNIGGGGYRTVYTRYREIKGKRETLAGNGHFRETGGGGGGDGDEFHKLGIRNSTEL